MLLRAMFAQNLGTGCAFGGLAVSVLAMQERYTSSLGMATLALSLTVLSMTGLGPVIANLIGRHGLRTVMSSGVVVSLLGYVALAYAPTMPFALAACALLIGPGAALFAALPPAVLASGWYPHDRGKVMGIVYLPLLVTLIPLFGMDIIQRYGLTAFYLSIAGLHVLLFPFMLGIKDPPLDLAQSEDEPALATGETPGLPNSMTILSSAIFLVIALGDGILNGTAVTGAGLLLPIVEARGVSVNAGAVLLALSGASSIVGSLMAGYACDRVGPARTLALASSGFALSWILFAFTGGLAALTAASFLIGMCGASVFPPISALVVQVFGFEALPKVLGLLGVMTLPFTFAMSPLVGLLHDTSGSYDGAFVILIGTCLLAVGIFIGLSRYLARQASEVRGATMHLYAAERG